jgi:hypothetical protein
MCVTVTPREHPHSGDVVGQQLVRNRYDAMNERASITASFAGAPGAAFVTYGIKASPWLVRGGVGAAYQAMNGVEITARYDAEYRTSFLNQTASIKARWVF